ncbi:MAG: 4-hydroxy-tetrahydrodipicolinate synthase [Bacteroidales bacterium]|jgi:4-hydroxy-tetrahydrodipicolinate synthase|nr:4-hydroxy-tetrahydrodipicolinate synthase [Bacteroidales bacterium]
MSLKKFYGTGVALITPFTNENTVDFTALKNLIEYVIAGGVDFIVVFGTTGEPTTLTANEKAEILEFVYQQVNERKPIVVGCGGNNTADIVKSVAAIDATKFDAILSVVPYYNKPNQRGIFEHYRQVAAASKLPVIAYNVPSRTGCNIEATTAIKIANEIPNIIGLKEASPSVEQFTYIKRGIPREFLLISGDDSIVLPHMSLGACGAISVTANAQPRLYSNMIRLCLEQNYSEALTIHLKLIEFTDSLFAEGSPAGVKAALQQLGIVHNNLRLPLVPVTPAHEQYIQTLLKQLA